MYPHIQLYCNDGRVGKGQPAKYGDLDGIKNKIAATMLQIVFQSYTPHTLFTMTIFSYCNNNTPFRSTRLSIQCGRSVGCALQTVRYPSGQCILYYLKIFDLKKISFGDVCFTFIIDNEPHTNKYKGK
jgi:hypothetical protein